MIPFHTEFSLQMFCGVGHIKNECTIAVTHQGFLRREGWHPKGCANLLFGQFFPKTTENEEN